MRIARVPTGRLVSLATEARLDQRHVVVPAAGLVADIFACPGEVIAAPIPVISLLPPQNILIRFFVPVPDPGLADLTMDQRLTTGCDGCKPGLIAEIVFIASNLGLCFAVPTMLHADAGAAIAATGPAAVDRAVGFHVPVPGHARLGPRARRRAADPMCCGFPTRSC